MLRMWTALQARFVSEEDGASLVEYGLLVALIAIVAILAVTFVGTSVESNFDEIGSRQGMGRAKMARAGACLFNHDYELAHSLWMESLQIAREVNDQALVLTQLAGLAALTYHLGRHAEAVEVAIQGLGEAREAHHQHVIVWMLDLIASFCAADAPVEAVMLEASAAALREKAGGGILSTVRATRAASEDELVDLALPRLDALRSEGVTTVEIKSGYGLETESELKMLSAARRLAAMRPVTIKTTFLGAHALPEEFRDREDAYIDLVVNEMMPAAARAGGSVGAGVGTSVSQSPSRRASMKAAWKSWLVETNQPIPASGTSVRFEPKPRQLPPWAMARTPRCWSIEKPSAQPGSPGASVVCSRCISRIVSDPRMRVPSSWPSARCASMKRARSLPVVTKSPAG